VKNAVNERPHLPSADSAGRGTRFRGERDGRSELKTNIDSGGKASSFRGCVLRVLQKQIGVMMFQREKTKLPGRGAERNINDPKEE